MNALNRYDMEIEQSLDVEDPNACVVDIPDDDGEWVKYDEAMAAIEEAREEAMAAIEEARDEAMAAIEEARDEARQQWPVGSVKWADESGKRYRRPSWRTHGNEGWANCLSDSSDGIYVRVLDAGRVSRYESYYLDIEDMFALDYELEPEEAP